MESLSQNSQHKAASCVLRAQLMRTRGWYNMYGMGGGGPDQFLWRPKIASAAPGGQLDGLMSFRGASRSMGVDQKGRLYIK